jgi:uncharacterized protein (TIGR03118 family)
MMASFVKQLRKFLGQGRPAVHPVRRRPGLEMLEDRQLLAAGFVQTNLVSDVPGLAGVTDPDLINPWGLASSPGGPFWVSDNNWGVSTIYNGQGQPSSLVVSIPGSSPGSVGFPNGDVFNTAGAGFDVSKTVNGKVLTGSSVFLFTSDDGVISGWSPGVDLHNAVVAVNNPGTDYSGVTLGTIGSQTFLYAANNSGGAIEVYDSNFNLVTNLAGSFHDPKIPSAMHPFNIQNINGLLYVTYGSENVSGPGLGFVDVYNTQGQLLRHLIGNGPLANPWGIAMAPSNFGQFSNDLLVGNFGNGLINAFDPATGAVMGHVTVNAGKAFQESGLWALRFGNGGNGGPTNTLFFTAGINGENDGLFGSLQALPPLSTGAFLLPNLPSGVQQIFSTVPDNGDLNPYGLAFVPPSIKPGGVLQAGDLLVSNFNSSGNTQGTGTTIVRIGPNGQHSTFFQGAAGLGLTTALGVLRSGFVIVGNLPAPDGTPQQGSLLIIDSNGNLVSQISDSALLNGPWDLAVNDQGTAAQVFVSNVLSGSVTRINLKIPATGAPIVESETMIASGYTFRTDPNALVVGPTGLVFNAARGVLYVAATGDNAIYAVPNALTSLGDHGTGKLIVQNDPNMHGPLGMVMAPNGDLIVANGDAVNPDPNDPNELLEFTPTGTFVGKFQDDPGAPGAAFGLAASSVGGVFRFAAVDDNTNTVHVWSFAQQTAPTRGHVADPLFALMVELDSNGHHRHGDLPW